MRKTILYLAIIIILAFILPSMLKIAFNIGILVLLLLFGYGLYKSIKLMDKLNQKKNDTKQ